MVAERGHSGKAGRREMDASLVHSGEQREKALNGYQSTAGLKDSE